MDEHGNIAMQFLWQAYHVNLAQVATQYATLILGRIAATVQGAVMLYIIFFARKMLFGAMSMDDAVGKAMRLLIVVFLMTAANYQTFIATPITETIPAFVNDTLTGGNGLQGAQGYDGLDAEIENFAAQARAQMTPAWFYIDDRIAIWFIKEQAEIILLLSFFIWSLAGAAADFMVPVGAIVLPFYLFDRTRSFAERWYGKVLALLLVMVIAMMLGQVTVYQDAQFVKQHLVAVAAVQANPDLQLGNIPGATEGPMAIQAPNATNNNDAMIDLFGKCTQVFLYGLVLLALVTSIGLYIGGAHGFSVAPAFNMAVGGARYISRIGR